MKFAKLFDIGNEQILFKKDFDDSDETYTIKIITDFDGMYVGVTPKYEKEETRDKVFDEVNQETANVFYKSIKEMVE